MNKEKSGFIKYVIYYIKSEMTESSHRFISLNPAVWNKAVAKMMPFECTSEMVEPIWDEVRNEVIKKGRDNGKINND